jgi:small subunit ribosomal protein S6
MPKAPLIYDLMLLLSSSAEDERRAKILADVEQTIADGGGTIEVKQAWGLRGLAYEIDHVGDAEYHLLQFSGPPALVETLSYNLKITDGVVRHRIIKVTPGTPPPPEPTVAAATPETPAAPDAPAAPETPAATEPPAETAEEPAEVEAGATS